MSHFDWNEELENWLLKNGYYSAFITEVAEIVTCRGLPLERCIAENPHWAIGSAFAWHGTQDGYEFWAEVDRKWYRHYRKVAARLNS